MDYKNYYGDGIGLHPETIKDIFEILSKNRINRIIEFGSGNSTQMLIDSRKELNQNYIIDSIDHSQEYAYKGKESFLNMFIKDIGVTNNDAFVRMFDEKKIPTLTKTDDKSNYRIENCFYIFDNDFFNNKSYDIVLLDGPHGNGRSMAFIHLIGHLNPEAYIIIDDYFHYDFVEKCQKIFNVTVIKKQKFEGTNKGHCILKLLS